MQKYRHPQKKFVFPWCLDNGNPIILHTFPLSPYISIQKNIKVTSLSQESRYFLGKAELPDLGTINSNAVR